MHIMLDLETWGTTPGSDIRSIGACVFDPLTGKVADGNVNGFDDAGYFMKQPGAGTFYIACDNPSTDRFPNRNNWARNPEDWDAAEYKYPLTRDPRTAQWWSEQSDEAQAAFAGYRDLKDALRRFDEWLTAVAPQDRTIIKDDKGEHAVTTARLWSHGSAFDPPILAAAYAAVGLRVPWHYRAPRDTRTIFDAAGIEDHSAWLAQHPGPLGITHHALDDAICQARAVCEAWRKLDNYPTEDAYLRVCRAHHWHMAQLRAHGIEPVAIPVDASHYPPEGYDWGIEP